LCRSLIVRAEILPTFSDAVYRIYEATLSPDHWASAMDAIATLSGSEGAFLGAKVPSGRWQIDTHSPKLSEFIHLSQAEKWWQQNPWLDRSIEVGFRVGDVYCDQDVIGEGRAEELPYYSQFLPRVGLGWQMAAAIQSDLGAPTAVVVQRARAKGPYVRTEMDTLRQVSRHVEQSLRITSHFAGERAAHATATAAFDAMDRAAFVLDHEQKPLLINRPARNLMGRYFSHEDGRLAPTQKHEHEAFNAAVRAARSAVPQSSNSPQPTTISDAKGGSRLVVWTLPVIGASAAHLGLPPTVDPGRASADPVSDPSQAQPDSHVLVLAQPLEQDRVIDPSVLRNTFDLTLGEARLAALLGSGMTVKQSADTLGITEGTARVVLKRVFQKLGVGRQAELVAKLAVFARGAS
jgi:DNA-binding CsgD family transcriptional regulator